MDFKKDLNDRQYEAVTTNSLHTRVVAGAGSGKTRVLTYRIAYLISEQEVKPSEILAITFTNKVANEMRNRVVKMIPSANKDLTIKTFHSFAASFLRKEINHVNFPLSFSIIDDEDQEKLLKDIASEMGYKRNDPIVGKTLKYIGYQKLHEKYPNDITIIKPKFEDEKICLEIYTRYEEEKNKIYSLDFDDLLLQTNIILENFPDVRKKWQDKYSNILIDEFQDTNDVEYRMIKFLKRNDTGLYVVGDPDQTIYTWRGANQHIILDLDKSFSRMNTIYLEQNYRSTKNILNSANKLIANNKMRFEKNLFTDSSKGDPIYVGGCASTKSEGEFVAREIKKLVSVEGFKYSDIALLYRSNFVTLDFETALTNNGIPYKVYGGLKFYQRREIKDVLAYFHLIVNIKDDIAFERIINVPKRGIGDTSINQMKIEAKAANKSLYEFMMDVDEKDSLLSPKVINASKAMIKLIEITKEKISKNDELFSKTIEDMIVSLNYIEYLKDDDDGDERIENVNALFEDVRHFMSINPSARFDEYLQNISLLTAQDEIDDRDAVTLMTVHTAKGLEFPCVFVVRFNQGIFPNNRALIEGGFEAMEEERRLAYVAFTRAMRKLYITFASGYSYVTKSDLSASQFFSESGNVINNTSIYNVNQTYNPYAKQKNSSFRFDDGENQGFSPDIPKQDEVHVQDFEAKTNGYTETDFKIGDVIFHKKFGKGTVIGLEGDQIITVNFESHGVKSILCNHPFVSKGGNEA
mgnify:CR=1 FL=1